MVAYKGNLQRLGRLRVKDFDSTKRLTNPKSCFSRVLIQPIVGQIERIDGFCRSDIRDPLLLSYFLLLLVIKEISRNFCGIPNDIAEPFS